MIRRLRERPTVDSAPPAPTVWDCCTCCDGWIQARPRDHELKIPHARPCDHCQRIEDAS